MRGCRCLIGAILHFLEREQPNHGTFRGQTSLVSEWAAQLKPRFAADRADVSVKSHYGSSNRLTTGAVSQQTSCKRPDLHPSVQ